MAHSRHSFKTQSKTIVEEDICTLVMLLSVCLVCYLGKLSGYLGELNQKSLGKSSFKDIKVDSFALVMLLSLYVWLTWPTIWLS